MTTRSVPIPTPYGPTGHRITVTPTGEVSAVESVIRSMPDALFRLSYGKQSAEAKDYLTALEDNVRYQAEGALVVPKPPEYFRELRTAWEATAAPAADGPAGRRRSFWAGGRAYKDLLFLNDRYLSNALRQLQRDLPQCAPTTAAALEPWLISVLPLVHGRHLYGVYEAIGRTGTATAEDFLFAELARPGRHTAAEGILKGLASFPGAAATERYLAAYDDVRDYRELIEPYLDGLAERRGDAVNRLAARVLTDHPREARAVLRVLQANDHPDPVGTVADHFWREEDYFVLDLLLGVVNGADAPRHRIDLAAMNRRAADPAFVDTAPVTWPQQLEPHWSALVAATPAAEFLAVMAEWLDDPAPRVQRNALLQLKTRLSVLPEDDDWLRDFPAATLDRLLELLDSRYDKVYTVVLSLLRYLVHYVPEPRRVLSAVLNHLPGSGYRMMNAAVLKTAARDDELKQYLRTAVQLRLDNAPIIRLGQWEAVLNYVKFLGHDEEYRRQVAERLGRYDG